MLIYHTVSGRYGSLYLQTPDKIGVMLAKHLKQDVCVSIRQQTNASFKYDFFEQVITPEGLQKGYEPEFQQYYQYIPIQLRRSLYFTFDRDTLVTLRLKFSGFIQARESLHQILNTGANLSQLGQWLVEGFGFAADLLGGIGTDEATNILLDLLATEPGNKTAMTGLFVHHLVTGDDVLAAYTIANSEILSSDDYLSTALFWVFLLRPTKHFPEVLQVIRKMQSDYIYARLNPQIRLIKDDVSDDVYFACFDPEFGPLGAHVFVRGTMNNWAINAKSDSQLIHKGDGNYETTLYLQADRHELKVAGQNWTGETNFGSDSPDHTLNLNRPFWLIASDVSPNLVLDLSAAETGFYRFLLDTNDINGPTLTVSPVDESNL